MKEIRFAWFCHNKHFDEISRVELTDMMLIDGSRPSWITSDNCEVIAKVLSIGQTDHSGKEIFEGDIVTATFDLRYTFGEGTYQVELLDGAFQFLNIHDSTDGYQWMELIPETVKVIGNIYENPELLTQ